MSDAAHQPAAPAMPRHLRVLTLAAGGFGTLLGLTTTAGWLLDIPGLVQVRPSIAPMVLDTALCFLSTGFGLLALGLGSRRGSRLCGVACGVLATLNLAGYVTNPGSGVDPARPLRMAPNTGTAFLLIGLALSLAGRRGRLSGAFAGGGAAGVVVLSLSTVALLGYAFGIQPAFGWGRMVAMSPQSAVGLAIVGFAIVAAVGRPDLNVGQHRSRWIAFLVGAAGATTTLLLWQALVADDARGLLASGGGRPLSAIPLGALAGGLLFSGLLAWSVLKTGEARLMVVAQRQSETALRKAHMTLGYAHQAAEENARAETRIHDQFIREVAERRVAEAERDRFFSLSIDMLCISSTDGYFKRLNPAFERTLGYTVEELTGRPFLDFVHPDDVAPTLTEVGRQFDTGVATMRFENRYRCKDGTYRWLSWTSMPDGKSGLMYALARDVTAGKGLEAEREHLILDLKSSLAEVRTLSSLLPMCAGCRRIQDDADGSWSQLEGYLSKKKSGTQVSHGICPECMVRLYPDQVRRKEARGQHKKT